MRLDKYLKVSRLIKRRTVANEACDNGLVTVNGKPARASYDVKVGPDFPALRPAHRNGGGAGRPGDGAPGGRRHAVPGDRPVRPDAYSPRPSHIVGTGRDAE